MGILGVGRVRLYWLRAPALVDPNIDVHDLIPLPAAPYLCRLRQLQLYPARKLVSVYEDDGDPESDIDLNKMTKDQAHREVIRLWRKLPIMERQKFEQAEKFAALIEAEIDFPTLGDKRAMIAAWLDQDILKTKEIASRI